MNSVLRHNLPRISQCLKRCWKWENGKKDNFGVSLGNWKRGCRIALEEEIKMHWEHGRLEKYKWDKKMACVFWAHRLSKEPEPRSLLAIIFPKDTEIFNKKFNSNCTYNHFRNIAISINKC